MPVVIGLVLFQPLCWIMGNFVPLMLPVVSEETLQVNVPSNFCVREIKDFVQKNINVL